VLKKCLIGAKKRGACQKKGLKRPHIRVFDQLAPRGWVRIDRPVGAPAPDLRGRRSDFLKLSFKYHPVATFRSGMGIRLRLGKTVSELRAGVNSPQTHELAQQATKRWNHNQ
jgi:hypothetical protein